MRRYHKKNACPKCGNGGSEFDDRATTRLKNDTTIERKCQNCAFTWDEATHDAPKEKKSGFPIPSFLRPTGNK